MFESMVEWASQPNTALLVLIIAGFALGVEAIRQSREALWGDFFLEDAEED